MAAFLQNPNRDVLLDVREQVATAARKQNEIKATRDTSQRRKLINEYINANRRDVLRRDFERYQQLKNTLWIENPMSILMPNSTTWSYFAFVSLTEWTADGIFEWIVANLNNITRISWLVAGILYATGHTDQNLPLTKNVPVIVALAIPLAIACVAKSALIHQDAAFDRALKPLNDELLSLKAALDTVNQLEGAMTSGPPPNVEVISNANNPNNNIISSTEKNYAGKRATIPFTSTQHIVQNSVSTKQARLAQLSGSLAPPPNSARIVFPKVF